MGDKTLQQQMTELLGELRAKNSPVAGSKKVPVGLAISGVLLTIGPHLQGELVCLVDDFSVKEVLHMFFHNLHQVGGMLLVFFGGTTAMQARNHRR